MKQSELAATIAILRAAYPAATLLNETSTVYETMLADLGAAEVQRAVYEHIATNNWFPSVAELRKRVAKHRVSAPGAAQALHQVQTGAVPMHPLARQALGLVGGTWEMRRTGNSTAWRAQFRDAYESLVEGALQDANVEPLLKQLGVANLPPMLEVAK